MDCIDNWGNSQCPSEIHIWCSKNNSTKKWKAPYAPQFWFLQRATFFFNHTKLKDTKTFPWNFQGKVFLSSRMNNTVYLILQFHFLIRYTSTITHMLAGVWSNDMQMDILNCVHAYLAIHSLAQVCVCIYMCVCVCLSTCHIAPLFKS